MNRVLITVTIAALMTGCHWFVATVHRTDLPLRRLWQRASGAQIRAGSALRARAICFGEFETELTATVCAVVPPAIYATAGKISAKESSYD